ncbi:hypothetical protein OOZ54_08160 [Rhodopseudomonas palustris]|uniref:hypothetical protein n=1 Tax=Rhodopseudomonas palustris TaxID=1076 RepID=UPI0022EFDF9A|nr:hypothetical protein [Rhodopseudomonas palustris]WBU31461.1 hypothetical protein OOZ54_08160 [Rhodopseudomonas palustris]
MLFGVHFALSTLVTAAFWLGSAVVVLAAHAAIFAPEKLRGIGLLIEAREPFQVFWSLVLQDNVFLWSMISTAAFIIVYDKLLLLAVVRLADRQSYNLYRPTPDDDAVIGLSEKVSEAEARDWRQYAGVRRIYGSGVDFTHQHLLVRSLSEADARAHFEQHGFKYRGRLAFNVPFNAAPGWLVEISVQLGRLRL